jgi:uncharacterized membrane protein (DUF2068 family)
MRPARGDAGAGRPAKRLSGLFIVIIVFKFLKAAAFLLLGGVVLQFVHLPRHGAPMEFVRFAHANSDRESIRRLSTFFEHVTPGEREAIGAAALLIGLVFVGEGILLLARVWWATYFTICMTLLGIPIELVEIWRKPYLFRGWVYLIINVAILAYLWRRRNEFRDEFDGQGIIAPPPPAAR